MILDFTKGKEKRFVSGQIICFGCKYEWIGASECGTKEFECPSCGTFKGRIKYKCSPNDGSVYTCNCDNDLFIITDKTILCANCGLYHNPYK